jgi:multiple sugar transport system ATP-binding protein
VGEIRLEVASKVYPNGVRAVEAISLTIHDGEFMVLVGPSGCGKSTLLRMIAGLEHVTEGRVLIGGQDVTQLQPRARDIAMVFQDYALYPQMTVEENLGFGLKLRHVPKEERRRRVREVARTLGLETFMDRRPSALSGGQRQRVAMGRAIVREPKAFLMDEPLSNLDAKLRASMRAELARLHERLGVTTVYVTHDQVEAMTLGQRVAVLREGVLQQCDTPQNLFDDPVNLFVAAFIGSPSMNLVDAELRDGQVTFAGFSLPLRAGSPLFGQERRVILGIRPTDFKYASDAAAALPRITARAEVIEELGGVSNLHFLVDAPRVVTESTRAAAEAGIADEGTLLADDQRALFCASLDGRRPVSIGDAVELAVDNKHFHFFDADTGTALSGACSSSDLTLAPREDPPRAARPRRVAGRLDRRLSG